MKRAALISLLFALGCAGPTGVDLRLVSDPNVNLESQVLAELDSIVLIVDSDEGLYAPGEERTAEGVQIENADVDPALELVATVPVPDGRLPVIRLEQGSLPDVVLELTVLGIPAAAGAPPSARGAVQAARLSSPPQELAVPFNLVPTLLPPRVSEMLPSNGDPAPGCGIESIMMVFSAAIDETTLADSVTLSLGEVTAVHVDDSGRSAQIDVTGLGGEPPTLSYRVTVAETVLGRDGRPLDQIPAEAGAQPFVADVELDCTPGMAIPSNPCPTAMPPFNGLCPFPDRFECVDNRCVPTTCARASCSDNEVCVPSTGFCELDCRLWGEASICPEERPTCDADTGACR